jgi:hypothetical protein
MRRSERYMHAATLQMKDASERIGEALRGQDEASCKPVADSESGPLPLHAGRRPVSCGGSGV